jgi:hypothetical protein
MYKMNLTVIPQAKSILCCPSAGTVVQFEILPSLVLNIYMLILLSRMFRILFNCSPCSGADTSQSLSVRSALFTYLLLCSQPDTC